MASQFTTKSDFTETFAVHIALRAALRSKLYRKNSAVHRTASTLCKELEGEKSIYGRQLIMINAMTKGATITELCRKLRCSRRTIFRYLNHLEEAGIDVRLDDLQYSVGSDVVRLLRH